MTDDQVHRATSADGTTIAGRVQGHGPALVLVHSPVHDGDMAWGSLLPYLTDRFTCYTPSLRSRGLSQQHPDDSPPRSHFQDDVTAFVDSVAGPVHLAGWSDGGVLALGSAADSAGVAATAVYEPGVWSLMGEDDAARFGATTSAWMEATAEGRLLDAAHIFHHFVCTDDEFDALSEEYLEWQASLFPLLMQELQQGMFSPGPQPTDPEVLSRIDTPVLVLSAQRTQLPAWFTASAQHISEHLARVHVRELPGAGHFAPMVAPAPVAAELIAFFESV